MKAPIIAFMETRKKERLRTDFINRQQRRFASILNVVCHFARSRHPNDFSPSAMDICSFSGIKDIVIKGTDEEFRTFKQGLFRQLPDLCTQCLEKRIEVLQSLIPCGDRAPSSKAVETAAPSESSSQDSPVPVHHLATSWYRCKRYCDDMFDYRDVLTHSHCCNNADLGSDGMQIVEFGVDFVDYVPRAAKVARQLIIACGKDPKVTTVDDMDGLQRRFALMKGSTIEVVAWRTLVS
jgi:hypothetical protein